MDALALLATQIVGTIGPYLPNLISAGGTVAQTVKQSDDKDWELAMKLWERLRSTVHERPATEEAVKDVAASPGDEDAAAALRLQLRKMLASDDQLKRDLANLLGQTSETSTVTASGERSVAIGGSASGTIITGDRNRLPNQP